MTLIHVTQHDIDNASRISCTRCPVALALQRTLCIPSYRMEVHSRYVDLQQVPLTDSVTFELPSVAISFIQRYDAPRYGDLLQPFSFHLDLPE